MPILTEEYVVSQLKNADEKWFENFELLCSNRTGAEHKAKLPIEYGFAFDKQLNGALYHAAMLGFYEIIKELSKSKKVFRTILSDVAKYIRSESQKKELQKILSQW